MDGGHPWVEMHTMSATNGVRTWRGIIGRWFTRSCVKFRKKEGYRHWWDGPKNELWKVTVHPASRNRCIVTYDTIVPDSANTNANSNTNNAFHPLKQIESNRSTNRRTLRIHDIIWKAPHRHLLIILFKNHPQPPQNKTKPLRRSINLLLSPSCLLLIQIPQTKRK